MANYPDYLNTIAGKIFPLDYIYHASEYQPDAITTTTGGDYQGTVSDFSSATGLFANGTIFGPISIVDADNGIFSITADPAYGEFQLVGASDDGNSLIFTNLPDLHAVFPTNIVYVLTNEGIQPTGSVGFSSSNSYRPHSSACFASGTMISTAYGEIAVEKLKPGQLVRCNDGTLRPILWVGTRTTRCSGNPWGGDHFPVLIERHAFARNLPNRDLYVSQWHSFEVDAGHLLQIAHLLNGKTIRRVSVDEVTYWHIELEEHCLIRANGLSAETYIDVGNRQAFDNCFTAAIRDPAFIENQVARYCCPLIVNEAVREHHRRRLDERADTLRTASVGWRELIGTAFSFGIAAKRV